MFRLIIFLGLCRGTSASFPPTWEVHGHWVDSRTDYAQPLATCLGKDPAPNLRVAWRTEWPNTGWKITGGDDPMINRESYYTSILFGAPIPGMRNHTVICVVYTAQGDELRTLPVKLLLGYPPTEMTVKQSSEGSVECIADGAPAPEIVWTKPGGSASANGPRMSPLMNESAIYACDASNQYGTSRAYFYATVELEEARVCWETVAVAAIAIGLAVGALAVVHRRTTREENN